MTSSASPGLWLGCCVSSAIGALVPLPGSRAADAAHAMGLLIAILLLPLVLAMLAAYAVVRLGLALVSLAFAPVRLYLLLRR